MGGEDEGDAARRIKLNARACECSLIYAVNEIFKSVSFFDIKCEIFAVGLEIEPDSRCCLRAESEDIGKRIKSIDLTLLYL